MNADQPDPVDEALRLLRDDDCLSLPDPELERRLRAHRGPRRWRPSLRAALWLLLALGLGGAGWAAHSGLGPFAGLRSRVQVDGQVHEAVSDEEGRTHFLVRTPSGTELQVRLHRHGDAGAPTTDLELREEAPGLVHEEAVQLGPGRPPVPRDRGILDDACRLHAWEAPRDALALYLLAEGLETVLLLDRGEAAGPVLEVARLPRRLEELERADIVEADDGGRELRLEDGRGWQFAWRWAGEADGSEDHYRSPDGRVRVEWEDGR